jgi:hypothetical protein
MTSRRCKFCYIEFVFWALLILAVVFVFLAMGCQAHVSAEGGRSSVERSRDVVTPKTVTVVVEEWTVKPNGGAK